jgi:hypothetical protein
LEYSIRERDGQTIHFQKAASEEVLSFVGGHAEIYIAVAGIHAVWEQVKPARIGTELGIYLIGNME